MAIQQDKITEAELQELTQFQQDINTITYQLGQLELRKVDIEKSQEIVKAQYEQLLVKEKEVGNRLKEKYGNFQIDLKTGDIIKNE